MSNPTSTSTRMRNQLAAPSHGSRTLTVEDTTASPTPEATSSDEASQQPDESIGVLRLRGDMTARRPPVVRWDDDVVDNEHMGKKKSKICCIYHKPRQVGDSSDSDSNDSSDSDSSDDGHSSADSSKHADGHSRHCRHNHHVHDQGRKKKRNPRSVSPNAYEIQPVYKNQTQATTTTI
ncbi:phosphatase inhibitor-domain-containing protein [Absidia repens]|uniref:Type 1 phosphatases regulator n=1 Tax=Absidia repens TaxID=90262 RepID=A0A1X2IVE8_9FUNG|nr:phosphatase inhibitor-domain-containing protein [Absidia repens]